MVKAAVMVTAPATRRPTPFGVATVADVQSSAEPWGFGGAQVEMDVCATQLQTVAGECGPVDPQAPSVEHVRATVTDTSDLTATVAAVGVQEVLRVEKTQTPVYGGITEADPFHLYLLDGCKTVGSWSTAQARVRRAFEAAESAGVDEAVLTQVLTDPTAIPASVNLCLAAAIGNAEAYAADEGWGQPVLFLARAYAPAAFRDNLLVRSGDHLETQTGSRVALVPDQGPDEGTGVLAIVPWLVLLQGALNVTGPTVDMVTNEFIALAERSYLALFPCAASLEFTVDLCVGVAP